MARHRRLAVAFAALGIALKGVVTVFVAPLPAAICQ
jgi:hypothetical protein